MGRIYESTMCSITLGIIRYVEHNFRENLDQPTGESRRRRTEGGGGRAFKTKHAGKRKTLH